MKSLRKESKDFARVGWILDYGLRFQEEKGGWVGKTRTTSDRENNIVEEEQRIDLAKDKEV